MTELNKKLETSPQLINSSPYREGWIVKLEVSDLTEKDKLMNSAGYRTFLNRGKE